MAAHDALHDLGLARRQQLESGANLVLLGAPFAPLAVAIERLVNAIDEVLVAKRFLQEIDRARFHRRHRHRNVAMARDENDRNLAAPLVEALLQLESAQARHSDIGHETRVSTAVVALEKIERRAERLVLEADRFEQHAERVADRLVVVDEIDDWP